MDRALATYTYSYSTRTSYQIRRMSYACTIVTINCLHWNSASTNTKHQYMGVNSSIVCVCHGYTRMACCYCSLSLSLSFSLSPPLSISLSISLPLQPSVFDSLVPKVSDNQDEVSQCAILAAAFNCQPSHSTNNVYIAAHSALWSRLLLWPCYINFNHFNRFLIHRVTSMHVYISQRIPVQLNLFCSY